MNYQQVKSFNQNLAGKVVGDCLANSRKGFGVAAKYPDAWDAWENTDHQTSALPVGVAVPAFFSYDGPTNGHVGVSLGNGQFWSDGVVYASIAAFEATHTPRYVGWSTSIDGVQVVKPVTTPVPLAHTITLPASSGLWHLYKPGGPYNPNVPSDVKGILNPAKFGGITYAINASLGNGVYRVTTQDFGQGDLWTSGSSVVIK